MWLLLHFRQPPPAGHHSSPDANAMERHLMQMERSEADKPLHRGDE